MNLIGRQDNVVVQPYGPRLKFARRLINDTFGSRKSPNWVPVVQKESVELLSRILSQPKHFRHQIQRFVFYQAVKYQWFDESLSDTLVPSSFALRMART